MLVDINTKEIVAKKNSNSDGSFAFTSLKHGDYKVVYEVPSPQIQSRLAYKIVDSDAKIVKEENIPYNEVKKGSKEGTRLMTGKLELEKPDDAYKISVELIDKYNRVVDHSLPNDDGTFEFLDRKSEHNEVAYQLIANNDPSKGSSSDLTRSQIKVKGVQYAPTSEQNLKSISELSKAAQQSINEKTDAKEKVTKAEMQMYKMYSRTGDETTITGIGFQVGAFRNLENVYRLMDKLKDAGYEAYVQSLMSHDIAGKFKPSTNYKLYRIVVYGTGDEIQANVIKNNLINDGFDVITKEKFKPVHQLASSLSD
jgi:cell division septation protein DedD